MKTSFPDAGRWAGFMRRFQTHKRCSTSSSPWTRLFSSPEFLSYLADRAIDSGAIVTTPEIDDYTQPLCTVYSLDFRSIAEQALRQGNYKIVPLFPKDRTLVIKEAELRQFAFAADMFENLNTPEDLARARRRFSGQDT